MKSLQEIGDVKLQWKRPKLFQKAYELYAGDEIVATLCWVPVGWFKTRIIAEAATGQWEFRAEGLVKSRTFIVDLTSGTEIASIKGRSGGNGDLQFTNGNVFTFRTTNFWRGEVTWFAGGAMPMMRLYKAGKDIEIEEWARQDPILPLLTIFGFYLMKIRQDAETAASAATVATVG